MSLAIDIGMDLLLIGIWGYITYLVLKISNEGYGDTLTSSYPYFVGGYSLFFVLMLVEPLQQYFILGTEPSTSFVFSLQLIQIVAGIMLVKGTIQLYNLTYATEGFFDDAEVDDDGE